MPRGRTDSRIVIPLRAAGVVAVLVTLLTGSLLLLDHGVAVWVELLYRLLTDGGLLLFWLAGVFGLGWPIVRLLSRWGSSCDETSATDGDFVESSERSIEPSGAGSAEPGLRAVASIAAGIGLLSLLILLLGIAGLLSTVVAWALPATGVAITASRLVVRARRFARDVPARVDVTLSPSQVSSRSHASSATKASLPSSASRSRVSSPSQAGPSKVLSRSQVLSLPRGLPLPLVLLLPVGVMLLLAALTPPGVLWSEEPHAYDVLSYHLQLPREWLERGRIGPLEHNVFSYFPLNVEMHYLLAMQLRGGAFAGMYLAQLMHAAMAMLLPVVIYLALRPRGRIVASTGAVLAGTNPWLLLLGGVAYNEAGLLLFATLSVVYAMRAMGTSGRRREWVLAGLFAGFACGAKLTAVPLVLFAIPVAMLSARSLARRESDTTNEPRSPRRMAWDVAAFVVAGLVSFSPWLVRNTVWTSNPVFPELTTWVGRGRFSSEQADRWQAAHAARDDQQGLVPRIGAMLRQSIVDWRGGHMLGGLIVVGIIVGLARRTPDSVMLATLLLLLLAFWLGLTHLQGRFLVLGLPLVALLTGSLSVRWSFAGLLPAVVSLSVGIVHAGPQLARVTGVLGLGDLTPLLRTVLPDERFVDRLLDSDRTVVLVGDARAFLYPVPMSRLRYRTVFDVVGDDLREAYRVPDSSDAIVVIDPAELRRLSGTYRHFPIRPGEWLMRPEVFALEP